MIPARLLSCVLVTSFVLPAVAQNNVYEELHQFYRTRGTALVKDARAEVVSTLTPAQRQVEETIGYSIPVSGNANAFARRLNGQRSIEITTGIIQMIDFLSISISAGITMEKSDCADEYMAHVFDGISRNSSRVAAGLTPNVRVAGPFLYASEHGGACRGLTVEAFRRHPMADTIREGMIAGSIKFLVGHEIGHHVLNHAGTKPASLADSRERERAADTLALRAMARTDTNPILGLPVMVLFGGVEGFEIEGEASSTHPAGVARLVTMLDAGRKLLANDPGFKAHLRQTGKENEWSAFIDALDGKVKELQQRAPASDATPFRGPAGNSAAASSDCQDVLSVVEASHDSFRTLRGARDRDATDPEWISTVMPLNANQCSVERDSFRCLVMYSTDRAEAEQAFDRALAILKRCLPNARFIEQPAAASRPRWHQINVAGSGRMSLSLSQGIRSRYMVVFAAYEVGE